jgi:hypothetical protein
MEEVESALIDYLQAHDLNDSVLQLVLGEIRNEIAAQLPKREADVVVALEEELAAARSEQKRLARAMARADDVSELVRRTHLHTSSPRRVTPGVARLGLGELQCGGWR